MAYAPAIGYNPNPSDGDLRAVAEHYLKTCQRKEYRQAKREGELDEWVALKAKGARTYAESMIAQGMDPGIAWNIAVRSELLGSESD